MLIYDLNHTFNLYQLTTTSGNQNLETEELPN